MNVSKADASVVIHRHEQELPTGAVAPSAAVAGNAMARPVDAAQHLGVNVDQIARMLMFVAHDGLSWLQVAQVRQASTPQNPAHSTGGNPDRRGDAGLCQPLAAQLDDRQGFASNNGAWAECWARGPVRQAHSSLGQVAPQPLAGGGRGHPHAQRPPHRGSDHDP